MLMTLREAFLSAGPRSGRFLLLVSFGSCVARSLLECEWLDPDLGLFRPVGNDSARMRPDGPMADAEYVGLRERA